MCAKKRQPKNMQEWQQLRSRFVKVVSHQLRTPLTGVRWNLEMMLDGTLGDLSDSQRLYLETIHGGVVTAIEQVADLVQAMALEEGRVTLLPELTNLRGLVRAVAAEFEEEATRTNIVFKVSPMKGSLASITVDPEKMREAMYHILRNAFDYTHRGDTITVALHRVKDTIRFSVTDTGIGIPAEEQKLILHNFYRASNAFITKPDASGVGLFIAKNFAELHGGRLGFLSKEEQGSTFWLEIPA